ncbi:nickel transporter NixA, partial [Staphylococcus aureus]|nr:nickel transporter NixA [Staphylococcus aureus]
DKLDLHGAIWSFIGSIEFDYLGYIIDALFLSTWLISSLFWKFGRIEHKWSI